MDGEVAPKEPDDLRPLLNFLTRGVSPDPLVIQHTEYREVKHVEQPPVKLDFEEETVVDGDVLRQERTAIGSVRVGREDGGQSVPKN